MTETTAKSEKWESSGQWVWNNYAIASLWLTYNIYC